MMNPKELSIEKIETKQKQLNEIILYNDNVNNFEDVIITLMDVLNHTLEQAEQCTMLVHYKGKCTVKTGEYNTLKPQCTKLLNLGLTAEIL